MTGDLVLRPELRQFAEVMERLMAAKDRERGDAWKWAGPDYLVGRLHDEIAEATRPEGRPDEWADVANFAMMLWWTRRRAREEADEVLVRAEEPE